MRQITRNNAKQKKAVAWQVKYNWKFLFLSGTRKRVEFFEDDQGRMRMVTSGYVAQMTSKMLNRKFPFREVVAIRPGWYNGVEFIPSDHWRDVVDFLKWLNDPNEDHQA